MLRPVQVLEDINPLESHIFKFRVTAGSMGTPDIRISKVRGSIPTHAKEILISRVADVCDLFASSRFYVCACLRSQTTANWYWASFNLMKSHMYMDQALAPGPKPMC